MACFVAPTTTRDTTGMMRRGRKADETLRDPETTLGYSRIFKIVISSNDGTRYIFPTLEQNPKTRSLSRVLLYEQNSSIGTSTLSSTTSISMLSAG